MDNQTEAIAVYMAAYKIAPSVIAKWPPPNYIDPQRRIWVVPLGIVLLCITTLVMAVRLYARITRMAGGFGLDDTLMIFAWVMWYSLSRECVTDDCRFSMFYLPHRCHMVLHQPLQSLLSPLI